MYIVADNLHVIHPAIAEAVMSYDPEPVRRLVRRCEEAGAQAIDVNSGPLARSPKKRFAFLVDTVQQSTSLPLLLDTTNPVALEAGLAICSKRPIINGFSLEPAKLEFILPLANKYNADIIGYLLGPNSQVPIEEEEMMTVAVAMYKAFLKAGLDTERLIVDPVVAPLSWDRGLQHNQAVLSLLRNASDLFGVPVRTIAGLSNLASGPVSVGQKIALEKAYLPMLAAAGLEMALVNVLHEPTVQLAKICEALLGDKVFTWAGIGE